MSQVPTITLADGKTVPQLGFGTWQTDDATAQRAVSTALEVGYRHIDTAAIYQNERGVGAAIAASGLAREEIFLTTKLWNNQHSTADARVGIEASLERLGLDRIDLFLIHWPATVRYGDLYIDAWDALQTFKAEGLVTSIGVSNFLPEHLDRLNGETPVVDQIEVHPSFAQTGLRAQLAERGIHVMSYSPLGRQADLTDPRVLAIAEQTGHTPAQVVLRWHLQKGLIPVPKSVTAQRIAENFDLFGFELSAEQLASIDTVDSDNRLGSDPMTADF